MEYTEISYEKKEGVAYITLNRPEKLNSLSTGPTGLPRQIAQAADEADADLEVKVVVIKGAGRAFSAGYDLSLTGAGGVAQPGEPRVKPWHLKSLADRQSLDWAEEEMDLRKIWRTIWENSKPFIAQVHGFCLAGGMDLANVCDIVIASDDAVFGYPPVRYGSITVTPTWWLTVGMHKAKEMVLTGNLFTAKEMYDFGMVNKVVPRDKLDEEVLKFTDEMVKMPLSGQRLNKLAVNDYFDTLGLQAAIQHVNILGGIVHTSRDEFGKEFWRIVEEKGVKAALEFRDARFVKSGDDIGQELRARKY